MKNKTIIIAEAGVNHNGDMVLAKNLIDIAATAGADYVKFQTFNASCLVTKLAPKANYQAKNFDVHKSQFEMLKNLELSEDMHQELIDHCNVRNIKFLSTGFDIQSINMLFELGMDYFKIPSGEITNLPYLRHIGSLGKNIILSTGMSTLGEIESAISVLEKVGTRRDKLILLHCTSEYPAPISEVNLRVINTLHETFGVKVGYSDHTLGIEVPIAAVAMGASVIEKHITLSRGLEGPDHKASLEPGELNAMVAAIRNIEVALGDGIKRITSSELINRPIARKSLVALKNIKKGEVLSPENITVKRPGSGISPMLWDEIIGTIANKDFCKDDLITR